VTAADSPPILASILVPTLDEAASIEEAVAAMLAQRVHGGDIEVIAADGRSHDATPALLAAMAERDPRLVVLENHARQTAAGLNLCLRHARGRYVVRMDAHSIYPPDYVALGIARLERGDVHWVCGPQLPDPVGPFGAAVAQALRSPLGQGGGGRWSGAEERELDTGVHCGVWRAEDVRALGGWDEGWPRNQDGEMAARFLRNGMRIVSLRAMGSRYRPRESVGALWRQYRQWGTYRVRTARRHPTSLRRSAVLPPAVVAAVPVALLAPRPLRSVARLGLAVYGAALAAAGARAEGPPRTRALVPLALATMHAGHGVGFLDGCRRFGVPSAALGRLVGVRREADAAPYPGPVATSPPEL
jgi:succinoglycan biosynthesis protein ExoA